MVLMLVVESVVESRMSDWLPWDLVCGEEHGGVRTVRVSSLCRSGSYPQCQFVLARQDDGAKGQRAGIQWCDLVALVCVYGGRGAAA